MAYCVVNTQVQQGDVFINGPFDTHEAAYAWALAFAAEQRDLFNSENKNLDYEVVPDDEGQEMVVVRLANDDEEIENELMVQLMLPPDPAMGKLSPA